MAKRDPKGDDFSDAVRRRLAETRSSADGSDNDRRSGLEADATPTKRRSETSALSELLLRTDGWLRMVPDGEAKTVWIKWKFTRGDWAGHYVLIRSGPYALDEVFGLLQRKINECYRGVRIPTKDTPFT